MKALKFFRFIIWIYFVYYACYMIYKVLGDDAIPLFVAGGLLFVLNRIILYKTLKNLEL